MRSTGEYFLSAQQVTMDLPDQVWRRVCRFDFRAPGFALVDFGSHFSPRAMREAMINLKSEMSGIHFAQRQQRLMYLSLGRFDQQETTKFHLDGAPAESVLMLGYEPTKVKSRIFLADYSKCAHDLRISVEKFLKDYNPIYIKGAEILANYSTLLQTDTSHWQILVINNSSKSWQADGRAMQGVMHMAHVEEPSLIERRIVNSIMIFPGTEDEAESGNLADQKRFIESDVISQKAF